MVSAACDSGLLCVLFVCFCCCFDVVMFGLLFIWSQMHSVKLHRCSVFSQSVNYGRGRRRERERGGGDGERGDGEGGKWLDRQTDWPFVFGVQICV